MEPLTNRVLQALHPTPASLLLRSHFSDSVFPFFSVLKTHQILGIKFFGGTSREAVEEITRRGGLLIAPAARSMINLCRDEDYRRALPSAELAIADSGFMVLLWILYSRSRPAYLRPRTRQRPSIASRRVMATRFFSACLTRAGSFA